MVFHATARCQIRPRTTMMQKKKGKHAKNGDVAKVLPSSADDPLLAANHDKAGNTCAYYHDNIVSCHEFRRIGNVHVDGGRRVQASRIRGDGLDHVGAVKSACRVPREIQSRVWVRRGVQGGDGLVIDEQVHGGELLIVITIGKHVYRSIDRCIVTWTHDFDDGRRMV